MNLEIQSIISGGTFVLDNKTISNPEIQGLLNAIFPKGQLTLAFATLNAKTVQGTTSLFGVPNLQCQAVFSSTNITPNTNLVLTFSSFPLGWKFSSFLPQLEGSILDQLTWYNVQIKVNTNPAPTNLLKKNFQKTWGDLPDPAELDATVVEGIYFSGQIKMQDLPKNFQWFFSGTKASTLTIAGPIELHSQQQSVGQQAISYLPKLWLKSQRAYNFSLIGNQYPLSLEFISEFSTAQDGNSNYSPDCFGRISTSYGFTINGAKDDVPFYAKFYGLQPLIVGVDAYFAGATKPISIDEIPALIGLDSGTVSSNTSAVPALNAIELMDIGFDLDVPRNQIQSVSVMVGTKPSWSYSFLNKFKFSNAKVRFYVGSPESTSPYFGVSLFGDVAIGQTTLEGSIFLPATDFQVQLEQGDTIDLLSWMPSWMQSNAKELACDELSLSGNIEQKQFSFYAGVETNLSFPMAGTTVALEEITLSASVGGGATYATVYGQFAIGGVQLNLSFSESSGDFQIQGGTMAATDIPVGKFFGDLMQELGYSAKVPALINDLEVSSFYFSYDHGAKTFSGSISMGESTPITIDGVSFDMTLQASFNRQPNASGTEEIDFTLTGQFTIGQQEFEVSLQDNAGNLSFQAVWESLDGTGIGFEDIASALGLDHDLSVPSSLDLTLTTVAISYVAADEQFLIAAGTKHGDAYFITQKDEAGKRGFIFGVSFAQATSMSTVPSYGSQFSLVDDLDLSQISLVLSSINLANFQAPTLPSPPNTNSPVLCSVPNAPIVKGASISAVVDFNNPSSKAQQNVAKCLNADTLNLLFTFQEASGMTPATVSATANLSGSHSIPTGSSNGMDMDSVSLMIKATKQDITFRLSGSWGFKLFNQPVDAILALSVSDDEVEISADIKSDHSSGILIPDTNDLYIISFGIEMGLEFEPTPSLDFGITGDIQIGQPAPAGAAAPTNIETIKFGVVMDVDPPNPLYLSLFINELDLSTVKNSFISNSAPAPKPLPMGNNVVNAKRQEKMQANAASDDSGDLLIEDFSLYWCETPQTLPDGTVTQSGFGFSSIIHYDSFGLYGDLKISMATGIQGALQLSPIHLGSILSITGDGKAIMKKQVRVNGKWMPATYNAFPYVKSTKGKKLPATSATTSTNEGSTAATTDPSATSTPVVMEQVMVAGGGPVIQFDTSGSPYFSANGKINLFEFLGIDVDIYISKKMTEMMTKVEIGNGTAQFNNFLEIDFTLQTETIPTKALPPPGSSGQGWSNQQMAKDTNNAAFGVLTSPSVTETNQGVFMAWNGAGNDGIWFSIYNVQGLSWSPQQNAQGFGIQLSPSVASLGNQVFMAWNGSGNDGVWHSIYDLNSLTWGPQYNAYGSDGGKFGIQQSPAVVAISPTEVFMAWSGSGNDGVWFSIYNTQTKTWAPQVHGIDARGWTFGLDGSPAVTFCNGLVYMAFAGLNNSGIWFTAYDLQSKTWSAQENLYDTNGAKFNLQQSPALTTLSDENLMLSWNGAGNDGIWFSIYDIKTNTWSPQLNGKGRYAVKFSIADSPTLTTVNGQPFMAYHSGSGANIRYTGMSSQKLAQHTDALDANTGNAPPAPAKKGKVATLLCEVHIQDKFTLPLGLGHVNIDDTFSVTLKVMDLQDVILSLQATFEYDSTSYTLGPFSIDLTKLAELPGKIIEALIKELGHLLGELWDDVKKWAEAIGKDLIAGVEDVAHAMKHVFDAAAKDAAAALHALGHAADEIAHALKHLWGAAEGDIKDILGDIGVAAADIDKALDAVGDAIADVAKDVAHVAEDVVHDLDPFDWSW